MRPARRVAPWVVWIAGLLGTAASLATIAGVLNRSVEVAFQTLVCALPLALAASGFIVLANVGKRSRTLCGFCGYDRSAHAIEQPCPECGHLGTEPNAPGHQAIGHRRLPWWIWAPMVLALPAGLVGEYIARSGMVILGCLAGLGLLLVVGVWHAAKQAR